MKKRYLSLLLLLGLPFFFLDSSSVPSNSFSLASISSEHPHEPKWEGRSLTLQEQEAVEEALSQEYIYFGKGGQSYTCFSEDGKYALKFFKQSAFSAPQWNTSKQKKMEKKRDKVYAAFKMAFDELPDTTGMLYIHLNPDHHDQYITVRTADGEKILLPLHRLDFALQRRAELAETVLLRQVRAHDLEGAKTSLDLLLTLPFSLHEKKIRNRDPNIRNNCGFINGNPILFDVGRFVRSRAKKDDLKSILRIQHSLRPWLERNTPELLDHFDHSIEQIVQKRYDGKDETL
jgi:hypothetical protein